MYNRFSKDAVENKDLVRSLTGQAMITEVAKDPKTGQDAQVFIEQKGLERARQHNPSSETLYPK